METHLLAAWIVPASVRLRSMKRRVKKAKIEVMTKKVCKAYYNVNAEKYVNFNRLLECMKEVLLEDKYISNLETINCDDLFPVINRGILHWTESSKSHTYHIIEYRTSQRRFQLPEVYRRHPNYDSHYITYINIDIDSILVVDTDKMTVYNIDSI